MGPAEQLKCLLEQIAFAAQEASGCAGQFDFGSGQRTANHQCVPRRLPASRSVEAAQVAQHIRPDNAPALRELTERLGSQQIITVRRYASFTRRFWARDQRTLRVQFFGNFSSALRQRLLDHFNAWTSGVTIHFDETRGRGDVRIGSDHSGNWSYIGTDALLVSPHLPTTNFDGLSMDMDDEVFGSIVQHQAGHALGFPNRSLDASLHVNLDRQRLYQHFEQLLSWQPEDVEQHVLGSTDGTQGELIPPLMQWQLPDFVWQQPPPARQLPLVTDTDLQILRRVYASSDHDL